MSQQPVFIHPAEARRQFREYAAGDVTYENLARGALLIALEDHPTLRPELYLAKLDALAERIDRRTGSGEPMIFVLGHLQAELFDVEGYRGDEVNYYDVRNAYLDEVIDRRVGLPITLSIIFLHVARQVGLNAHGVGLPGHFIVKTSFELNEVFIDPFQRGVTLTMQEVAGLVERAGERLSSEHLRAWSAREILLRVLVNLQSMWAQQGDARKATSAAERLDILRSVDEFEGEG